MGDPQMLRYFAQLRGPFSVSTVAEAGAIAALKDEAHIRFSVEHNAEGVEYLTPRFQELGFRVVPTNANFIYVEILEDSTQLGRRIQNEGCIVRSLAPWGIPNSLRISVGTPEQTGLDALEFIAAGACHVALGTVLFADPAAPARVRAELHAAAAKRGWKSCASTRTRMSIISSN